MASRRRKGPARWLVVGLSGLATAGFLGAIISRPGIAQQPADAAVNVPVAPALTNPQQPSSVSSVQSPSLTQPDSQPVVRAPRFRTRGS